jgi:MFS transporter, PAT family, solute carrier family 33 (acetyl-CoA transportor), member 1
MGFLKLIEAGVPKETLSLLAIPLSPLQILLPLIMNFFLQKSDPFKYYSKAFLLR